MSRHLPATRFATARFAAALFATALFATGCSQSADDPATTKSPSASGGADSGDTLVIYSGRSEELVGPLLDQLGSGAKVEVRYGDSSELAAQLLEEGEATKADLFFSQDAGALGALAKADRLAELPTSLTDRVPADYVGENRRWVATSARARVIAYNPAKAPEVTSMTSIDAVLDPKYRGQVGFAPTNASFHAFVTALRVDRGEDGAREWLTRFKANEPVAFEKNGLILDAVNTGQVGLGLINHYYWYEKAAEVGAAKMTAKVHFLNADDPGALINVAGVGVLTGTDNPQAAQAAIAHLLSNPGQQYFADSTAEYPVVDGVTSTKHGLVPLAELTGAGVDLGDLDSLDQTLAMLEEVGLT